jgi:hypothetical protein
MFASRKIFASLRCFTHYGIGTTFVANLLISLGAKSLDLQWQVEDFKKHTRDWELYDAEVNHLSVVNIRK